jgi:thioredoxin reductase (NADPH)
VTVPAIVVATTRHADALRAPLRRYDHDYDGRVVGSSARALEVVDEITAAGAQVACSRRTVYCPTPTR